MRTSKGALKSVAVWYLIGLNINIKSFSFFSGKCHLVDVSVREGSLIHLRV
jgi:hypothetical protein